MSRRALRVSAPARANLVGNPSDLSGGAILSCSVPLRARVRVTESEGPTLHTGGRTLRIDSSADLETRGDPFDLGRAALRASGSRPRAALAYESEIPLQSGLAGSSALLVSLLHAILVWEGRAEDPYALAERARRAEKEILGVTCGFVDHYLCAFGGLRYVDFREKEGWRPSEEQPYATVEPLDPWVPNLPFLLAFTGVRHDSGSVHAPAQDRLEQGDPRTLEAHRRMAAIAVEGKTALLRADWPRLGALMNENHGLQRALGGSGDSNERLVEAALGAGALGAKLAGAGHGGTIVALAAEEAAPPVEAGLRTAGAVSIYRPRPVPGVTVEP